MAISADDAEASTALAARLGLGFSLLSDPDLAVAVRYGVAMAGRDIAVPAVLVVRRDRTVAWRYVGEDMTDRPRAVMVLEQVRRVAADLAAQR